MDRVRYARYVVLRLSEAILIALGAACLARLLQDHGWISPVALWRTQTVAGGHSRAAQAVAEAGGWVWPAVWALLAHLALGPKQTRPVYRRIPGAMFAYAGVTVDRSAGCRGGLVTGATGSGKTLACIIPRLHSLCVNEAGIERPEWSRSRARAEFESLRRAHRALAAQEAGQLERLGAARAADGAIPDPGGEDPRLGPLRSEQERRALELRNAADACRAARFAVPPWGGFVCGEKGNEGETIEALLRHHGREEDLCLLRSRPQWAPAGWRPPARLNLLSMDGIPADTYAQMLVDTGLAVEESGTRDEFFVPQARDKIAWGIRLVRAVAAGGGSLNPPSLLTVCEVLTVQESYRRYLAASLAAHPPLASSGDLQEARFQLENNYWNQPPDQLGGVRSTVHNFLSPYSEPEIAEVFCADSTFALRDIGLGKVVCLAIPQKLAVQRRYVATLLKALAYRIILERFDQRGASPGWRDRNVILVEQDEWQRHAVRADCEADVVREAHGAVYAAAQSQNAVWVKLGGKERAAPLLANLRNRWICQAATEECAEESSGMIGGGRSREVSHSRGDGGRTTSVSYAERPFVPKRELRSLAPFHVVFAPAQGLWLYRRCIAMPATPDGRIPPWWFGDWNPLHWAGHFLRLPETVGGLRIHPGQGFLPPWRACAPLRAQLRRLAGLDGTFIILGGVRASAAARSAGK